MGSRELHPTHDMSHDNDPDAASTCPTRARQGIPRAHCATNVTSSAGCLRVQRRPNRFARSGAGGSGTRCSKRLPARW